MSPYSSTTSFALHSIENESLHVTLHATDGCYAFVSSSRASSRTPQPHPVGNQGHSSTPSPRARPRPTGVRDIEQDEEHSFWRVGAGVEGKDTDPKQKNKDRQPPWELQHSKERANYRSLALQPGCENYMSLLPPIADLLLRGSSSFLSLLSQDEVNRASLHLYLFSNTYFSLACL